jgi:hypothetical protein
MDKEHNKNILKCQHMDMPKKGKIVKTRKAIVDRITDEIIFSIPCIDDDDEKGYDLENQIYSRLIKLSNKHNNYDLSIDICQANLRALIWHYPEEGDIIRASADRAGIRYLNVVQDATKRAFKTTIQRGEMFLKIHSIKQGKNN